MTQTHPDRAEVMVGRRSRGGAGRRQSGPGAPDPRAVGRDDRVGHAAEARAGRIEAWGAGMTPSA